MATTPDKKTQVLDFTTYKATHKLKVLAARPFDLTTEGNLTPERINRYCASAVDFKLLYGTERIDDATMNALFELAEEAQVHDKMQKMQAGEVLNVIQGYPSENRSVLHTATRDFFEQPQTSEIARAAAHDAKAEVLKLKDFIDKLDRDGTFTDLIMIGIGGSDLGPRAHYFALQHLLKKNRNVRFICNLDPDDTASAMLGIDLKKALVVVVSKTGTTLETLSNEMFVKRYFTEAKLKPEEHFVTVSLKGSPLDDRSKYLECFYMWDWIGGRYSTTSMVGGVMLSFAFGFNVFWEFLRGANAMDKAVLNPDPKQNLSLIAALLGIWNRTFLHYPSLAIIPYSQALWRYTAHIQQLDMESNGKHIDKHGNVVTFDTGPILWGEAGTNSQHSFFQMIHQGTTVVPLEFVGFKESQMQKDNVYNGTTSQQKLLSNLFAQMLGLATGQTNENPNKVFEGNRPSHLLLGKQLTPHALGALLSFFEHKIAFQGFIWNINSFDQEGVQLGKVLANKIIGCFAAQNEQLKETQLYPLGDALLRQLDTF